MQPRGQAYLFTLRCLTSLQRVECAADCWESVGKLVVEARLKGSGPAPGR